MKNCTPSNKNFNNIGPPYTREKYETLDYLITPNRWKNSIKNIEADKDTNVYTDHIALTVTISIKLKAQPKTVNQIRNKYEKCSTDTKWEFNNKLRKECEGKEWKDWIREDVENTLPKIQAKRNKTEISEEVQDLLRDRGEALKSLDIEKAKELNKEIIKQRKREKNIRILESVKKDLDLRDRWLGLRNLRKDYQPIPYSLRKEENGEKVFVRKKRQSRIRSTIFGRSFLEAERGNII